LLWFEINGRPLSMLPADASGNGSFTYSTTPDGVLTRAIGAGAAIYPGATIGTIGGGLSGVIIMTF
jgi:hypothetical protein